MTIRLLRVELVKLATMRVTYGVLLAVGVITGLFSSLEATGNSGRAAPISTTAGLETATTSSGMAMVLAAVLGVIVAGGEFRHSTATLTYLTTPGRGRVLVAKAGAAAVFGVVYGLLAATVSTIVGLSVVASRGYHDSLGLGTLVGHIAGAGLGAAICAAVGVALGTLIRSQLAGVITVLVWCLVIESIVGGSFGSVRPYLPYTAAATLGGAKLGAAAFGPGYRVSGQQALPFLAAAALVVAIGLATALLSRRTTLYRDVT